MESSKHTFELGKCQLRLGYRTQGNYGSGRTPAHSSTEPCTPEVRLCRVSTVTRVALCGVSFGFFFFLRLQARQSWCPTCWTSKVRTSSMWGIISLATSSSPRSAKAGKRSWWFPSSPKSYECGRRKKVRRSLIFGMP